MQKRSTSFKLSDTARDGLKELADKDGLTQAGIIETLVRQEVERRRLIEESRIELAKLGPPPSYPKAPDPVEQKGT